MSNWLDVCGLDDISPDTGICALVNGAFLGEKCIPNITTVGTTCKQQQAQ